MIDKKLINTVSESKKYIAANVIMQWIALIANIVMITAIADIVADAYYGEIGRGALLITGIICGAALVFRAVCTIISSKMSYMSSKAVKHTLRDKIYKKVMRLGASYKEKVSTSELVQLAVEGVDQLETYFGAYMPQFFYAVAAPLTLFAYMCTVNVPSAVVLLICVPLIPVSIVIVQRWAKKLLAKYWGQYTELGDSFLENLQGLTTLKIYQADDLKNQEMNVESENFRRITMKVLTMQLNSITIMDLIAYGGAAIGVIVSATQFKAGNIDLAECLLIILLAADFFIPMRMLGSFFHIAMNGMAASEKIFRVLDLEEPQQGTADCPQQAGIVCEKLYFAYEEDRMILKEIDMNFEPGNFTAIVGESGCGKSTMAGILMGRNRGYGGSVTVGGTPLQDIREESLMENFTYISHQSYLFKGTVRDNLLMGRPDAEDSALWQALSRVNLAEFLKSEQGLDTALAEKGGNLSGGQCQRLALARALLHDSQVYIFDEATSNIDVESENDIMREIAELAKTKTVIMISHRLANVRNADRIYMMQKGRVAEWGSHDELMLQDGAYSQLWNAQQLLEQYAGGDQ